MSAAVDLSVTAVLGTLIGLVYWYLKHWWIELHIGMYLPPGPRPVPFLGNAHQLGLEDQHEVFAKWEQAYGESSCTPHRGKSIVTTLLRRCGVFACIQQTNAGA